MLELNKICKGDTLLYKEKFSGSEAIVKIINAKENEGTYSFLVKLLEVKRGLFPKHTFKIVITEQNALGQSLSEI